MGEYGQNFKFLRQSSEDSNQKIVLWKSQKKRGGTNLPLPSLTNGIGLEYFFRSW